MIFEVIYIYPHGYTSGGAMSSTIKELEEMAIKKFGIDCYNECTAVVTRELEVMEIIAEKRIELGMRQIDFAKALGTTQAQLSRYETLQRSPTLKVLLKMFYILDIKMELIDSGGTKLESKWKI